MTQAIDYANYDHDLPFRLQHEGSDDLAIKNTFIRRILVLLALKTTARFYKRNGACFPILKSLIVKSGAFVHLEEAIAMKFIAHRTSIPVPKVHCSFLHKGRAYIVMERIQGGTMGAAWKSLGAKSRAKIFAQLKTMIQELRALKPPHGSIVESCVGNTVREPRIPRQCPRIGPFDSI